MGENAASVDNEVLPMMLLIDLLILMKAMCNMVNAMMVVLIVNACRRQRLRPASMVHGH